MELRPYLFVSLFIFYIFSYLLSKIMGCFSGCLMSSASIQKLFCGVYSAFKCSFDEFVGEKVVSPSYSSAIFMSVHIERAHQLPITMNEKDPYQDPMSCNLKIFKIKEKSFSFSEEKRLPFANKQSIRWITLNISEATLEAKTWWKSALFLKRTDLQRQDKSSPKLCFKFQD